MNEVGQILELGQRLAFAVLRLLIGLITLVVGAVSGRRRRGPAQLTAPTPVVEPPDIDGFGLATSLMEQMRQERASWPAPPPTVTPPRRGEYRRGPR